MSTEKHRKARGRAAEVLVRTALSQVPVVGPFLSGGIELIGAVRDEIGKDASVTRQDVLDLIRGLPRQEYERIVDEQLVLNENVAAVANVDPYRLLDLRRQLLALPDSIGRMLANAQAVDENAHGGVLASTRDDLRVAMENRRWFQANRLARRLRRMGVRDREIVRTEQYTYGRHVSPNRVVFSVLALSTALVISHLVLERFDGKFDRNIHLMALFGSLLVFWWPATTSRLTIGVRTTFRILTFVYLGIWLLRFYKVWPEWLRVLGPGV